MIDVPHTISATCRDNIIQTIRFVLTSLGEDTISRFKRCEFGKYLSLPDNLYKSNASIHYVISREVIRQPPGDPTILWFKIGDKQIRFSRFEYALITGLRFGPSNFDPCDNHTIPEDSTYTRCLGNSPILANDLKTLFLDKNLNKGAKKSDYLKVAKVLLACHMLIAFDCTKTFVPEWLWILVEDKKRWESFPWGSYSYQILFQHLSNVRTCPNSGKSQGYHLNGFLTAFLVRC